MVSANRNSAGSIDYTLSEGGNGASCVFVFLTALYAYLLTKASQNYYFFPDSMGDVFRGSGIDQSTEIMYSQI